MEIRNKRNQIIFDVDDFTLIIIVLIVCASFGHC